MTSSARSRNDCQPERLRGLEIDDQLELRGLLTGKSRGFAP